MHLLWPQHYETRSQPKEKIWEGHRYTEVEQHATKQQMDQPRNQRGNFKKYMETNENVNTMVQNLWNAAKTLLRGYFIAIQAYLRKTNLKRPNLTPKGARKRTNKTQIQ